MKAVRTSTLLMSRNGLEVNGHSGMEEKGGGRRVLVQNFKPPFKPKEEEKKKEKNCCSWTLQTGFCFMVIRARRPFQQERNGKSSGYTPFHHKRRFWQDKRVNGFLRDRFLWRLPSLPLAKGEGRWREKGGVKSIRRKKRKISGDECLVSR